MIYMVFDESIAQMACNVLNNHLIMGGHRLCAEVSHTRSVEVNSDSPVVRELAIKVAARLGGHIQAENSKPWSQPIIEGLHVVSGGIIEQAQASAAKRQRKFEENDSCLLSSLPYNKQHHRKEKFAFRSERKAS